MIVLVFDTETTGLPQCKTIDPHALNRWPYIVQLSFVLYDTSLNEVIQARDCYIQLPPHVTIPQVCVDIHGVTNEMCATRGVPLQDAFHDLFQAMRTADVLVGHNVQFDINLVKVELMRMIFEQGSTLAPAEVRVCKLDLHYITYFEQVECTCTNPASIQATSIEAIGRNGEKFMKWPKLIELYQTLFHNTPNQLHNSLFDVLATLRCYLKMNHHIDVEQISDTYNMLMRPNLADSPIVIG